MPAIKPTAPAKKTLPANQPPVPWGPVIAIVVTISIYFLSQFIASFGLLFFARLQGMSGGQVDNWFKQTLPQFYFIVLVEASTLALLYGFIRRFKASFKTLGLRRIHWKDLGYSVLGFGIYFPLLVLVFAGAKVLFPHVNFDQQQDLGFNNAHGLNLVWVYISLAVLPPFTEELVTRGFLYLGLKKKLKWFWAGLITSLMFASAHLEFGSGAPLLWTAALDTFVLSWVLIWLRERTGGLWSSIGLHMIKNSIAFAALFIFVR